MTGADPGSAGAAAVLASWRASDAEQDDRRRAYLEHLDRVPDGVWRSGRPDHLTASCLVLDPAGERVLLQLHVKARLWLQMGGHVEPGDASLADAALREAREESGLDDLVLIGDGQPLRLDVHPAPCDRRPLEQGGARHHLDVQYAAVAATGAVPRANAESLDVRWWPVGDLPGASPELRSMVDAGLERAQRSSAAI